MKPKILKTEEEYETALGVVKQLLTAPSGSTQADDLELWSRLVEEYELEHYAIPLPDPITAIRFRMEQQGLQQSDLVPYIGSRSKVSEVLSGKRSLSLAMIRRLHSGLGIPAKVLLQDPHTERSPEYEGLDRSA